MTNIICRAFGARKPINPKAISIELAPAPPRFFVILGAQRAAFVYRADIITGSAVVFVVDDTCSIAAHPVGIQAFSISCASAMVAPDLSQTNRPGHRIARVGADRAVRRGSQQRLAARAIRPRPGRLATVRTRSVAIVITRVG